MVLCVYRYYMGVPEMGNRDPVRLNDLDWELLDEMADGRRYTQKYLADDVPRFDDQSYDWIRQRMSSLYSDGLIERVGTSQMYQISDLGRAALELRDDYDEDDLSPREFGDKVRERAQQNSDSTNDS